MEEERGGALPCSGRRAALLGCECADSRLYLQERSVFLGHAPGASCTQTRKTNRDPKPGPGAPLPSLFRRRPPVLPRGATPLRDVEYRSLPRCCCVRACDDEGSACTRDSV